MSQIERTNLLLEQILDELRMQRADHRELVHSATKNVKPSTHYGIVLVLTALLSASVLQNISVDKIKVFSHEIEITPNTNNPK